MKSAARRGHQWAFAAAIFVVTGIRLIIAARLPLSFDEAYYWRWSQQLSLAYPDHPPLVAWLIQFGVAFAGSNELGVRLCFVLLSGLGMALIYKIALRLDLTRPAAVTAMLMATALPAVSVGSLLATPDLPLGVCALGTVLLLISMTRGAGGRRGPVYLAVILALGFYAKLAAGLLVLTVAVAAAIVPPVRKRLLAPEGFIALVTFALLIAPLAAAEWRSSQSATLFQLARLDPESLNIGWLQLLRRTAIHLSEVLSGQLGLMTPLVAWFAVVAWLVRPRSSNAVILSSAWWIPVAVTCCAALFTHPEQNWAALGHPFAALMAAWVLTVNPPPVSGRVPFMQRHRYKLLAATLAGVLVPTVLIHVHALSPFLPLPAHKDPIGKLHGYQSLVQLPRWPADDVTYHAIFADNYALASQTAWALRDAPLPVASCDRPARQPLPRGTWLILTEIDAPFETSAPDTCRETRPLHDVAMRDPSGRVVRRVAVGLGFGCKYRCER